MRHLELETDPADVGLDADRLARIEQHFARYVADGRLKGWSVAVARRGRLAYLAHHGHADAEAGRVAADDTVWRIYSMTKAITTVALMTLFEEGRFELNDPVSRYIPSFADCRVWKGGTPDEPHTVPAQEPMRIWHLLSHTSGLTYGFMNAHPVDAMYRNAGFDFGNPRGVDLAEACDRWAALPLLFEPGTAWGYSVATDVVGRLIEVLTGRPLDEAIAERVLRPLGMDDTTWSAEGDAVDRLAALYIPNGADGTALRWDPLGKGALHRPELLSGGGGMLSTLPDYHRFVQMLAGGGAHGGVRILGPRTLSFMTRNHLPNGADLASFGSGQFAEVTYSGVGFGLGFGVATNPVRSEVLTSVGEYTWGGAASTAFFVDPTEELTAVFMTQLLPSGHHPLRSQLRQLIYQSIVE